MNYKTISATLKTSSPELSGYLKLLKILNINLFLYNHMSDLEKALELLDDTSKKLDRLEELLSEEKLKN